MRVSVTAPPKPKSAPLSEEPADRAALEALIEEARRRTRRRRRRYAAAALLVAGGIGVGVVIFGGSRGPAALTSHPSSPGPSGSAQAAPRPLSVRNGPLTVADGNGIFALDGRGVRHDLFRCADVARPRFCSTMEGIAWSPAGDKLLFSSTTISIPSRYNGMHVLDLGTGKATRAGIEAFSPAWSRDGRIAVVEPTTFGLVVGSIYIRVIDRSVAMQGLLATGTEGYDSSPSWSLGGARLVFATRQS